MPKSETAIISAPQGSSSEIARQWLVKFATICQKDFSPALANMWDEQLSDIQPDHLARACDKLMKEWTSGFLPVPGNIRKVVELEGMFERLEREIERRKKEIERRKKEITEQKAKVFQEHQRAIAYAERQREQRLLEAKNESPKLESPKYDRAPVCEPVRMVDIEGRRKELQRQADSIKAKYPSSSKKAAIPA